MVDITGTGLSVARLLQEDGLRPIAVTVTNGVDEGEVGRDLYRVAKAELVANLVIAYQSGRMRIARALPLVGTFLEEMQNFKLRSPILKPEEGLWRDGEYDDLVYAVALATWRATRRGAHFRLPGQRRERPIQPMGWML